MMVLAMGGADGAAQDFNRASSSLSPLTAPDTSPGRLPSKARSARACPRLRAAMLGSAGRRALLIACLPALLLTQPLSSGAAQAADVTISTPTTGATGAAGADDPATDGTVGGVGYQYSQSDKVTVSATVTGGTGGKGGEGGTSAYDGGAGGAGGAGLKLSHGGTALVNAAIVGGRGGAGGNGIPAGYQGMGGAGLVFDNGGSATINAAVTGGAGSAGGVGIVGGGLMLTLGSAGNITGGLHDDGVNRANAITFTGGTNRLELWSGATVTGYVRGSGTNTFALGGTTDGTFAVSRLGGPAGQFGNFMSFEKAGASTWTLTGTSSFTGSGVVNAGTLAVNGDITHFASLTVNPGGTLGGTGSVGTTTIAGGRLAPGNSIGTLTVRGNLSFTTGSTYAVEVSPSDSDRVNVTGTATLGGATVAASFAAGTYVAKQYTILNAAGGVNGTFGTKVDTNLPSGFKSSLGYDASNAYLNLVLDFTPTPAPAPSSTPTPAPTPTPTPSGPTTPTPPAPTRPVNQGLNPNQTAAANALTGYFNRTGGIQAVFGSLTPAGLSQVAGEPATGAYETSANAMTQFMGALTPQAPEGRGVPLAAAPSGYASYTATTGQTEDLPTRKGAMAPAITPDPDLWRWSVWAGGYGAAQFNGADAGAGTSATTSRIYGAMAGADYRISPDTVAGFALGGGATSFNTYGLGSGSSDLFQTGAFIRQQMGRSYVTASAAYAWQDVTTDRNVVGIDRLQGRFNANTWSGRIEAGHRFGLASVGLTPYAAGQVTTVSLPGYRETALSGPGTFALSYAGKDTTRTRTELGLRADAQLVLAGKPLKLEAGAAWIHNGNTGTSALASFQTLPGASFVVGGTALDRNALRTTASAELRLAGGFSLAASLEGEFAQNSRSFGGKTALRYQW